MIDLYGLNAAEVQDKFPAVYHHLTETVRPERIGKAKGGSPDLKKYAEEWWLFGKTRPLLRSAMTGIPRYISTIETAAQRFFQFLDDNTLPDNMLINLASDRGHHLAILSSRIHWEWVKANASSMGAYIGPARWTKTRCFDPFPFPVLADNQSTKLDQIGERLDVFRKERLAEHDFLTMTDIYNVLERYRELDHKAGVPPLTEKELDIAKAAKVSVLKDIHDDIDREVFAAYGWEDLGQRLVGKPGATTPNPHKSEDQEAAEQELLVRLVALNQERAAEEKRGLVRWLRPEYQQPRLAHKVKGQDDLDMGLDAAGLGAGVVEDRSWPAKDLEQIRALRDVLFEAEAPLPAAALATLFKGRATAKRKSRVAEVLATLADTGLVREGEGGYFLPR